MKSINLYIVGICYVLLSLSFGEAPPFTLVPMYSSFPNWAYSFFLTDSNNNIIPSAHYFKCADDELSHMYSTICDKYKMSCGNQIESPKQLDTIGNEMHHFLKTRQYKSLPVEQVRINRVCYLIHNDTIVKNETIMHETKW